MRFNTRLPLLVAILTSSLPLLGAITRTFEKTFPASESKSDSVKIDLFSGSVSVEESDSKEVKVVVKALFEAEKEDQADRLQSDLKLVLEARDAGILVSADYARDIHWTSEDWPPVKLAVVISVPKGAKLDLSTKDGSISVGNLSGVVRAKTESGLIYLKGIDGSVDLESFSGDVVMAHCTGDVRLRSVSGDFTLGPIGGSADVSAHGGSMEAANSCAGIRADTTGADLVVTLPSSLKGNVSLRSSGGNVILSLDPRLGCSLDLHSSVFGKVAMSRGQLPITVESGAFGKRSLRGGLNAGSGPHIEATVSGGSVLLEPSSVIP